ncbi:glycosyltransferase [Streptomyces sp. ODS05-4]|uniref:glycosyltransferase n=1 Tax=Streptomyces sp. ODS05-4 TaxID=2944939 RepID=UPI002108C860|nr:glycosyltransferase [Streptomyces sp. ODS05-4]
MRILLQTAGSRGDVAPFAALARRAAAQGHEVRLCVPRDAVLSVNAGGVDVVGLDVDFRALAAAQGTDPWQALRSFRTTVAPAMRAFLLSAARAAADYGPDVLVHHPKVLCAPISAAALGVPRVRAELVPAVTPTRRFPAVGVVDRDLGPLNRLTYRASAGAERAFAPVLRAIRQEFGVPSRGALPPPALTVVPVSPALLPRPEDWPAHAHLTGAWYEDGREEADARVSAFLAADGPVVYAGFGSMRQGDPRARARAVITAARVTGHRVLVATGWGGLAVPDDLLGDDLLVREEVPHADVLPRTVAAVHHGGVGTTHAVLRSGAVSVTVPCMGDQRFWGRLLHERGLAPPPVSGRPDAAALANAFRQAARYRPAVAVAARRVRAEDGVGRTLELLAAL